MSESENGSRVDLHVSPENINARRRNGFHTKYLELCKSKNMKPVLEVRMKQRNHHMLDFHCDRIKIHDWGSILSCLTNDSSLEYVAIRLRKNLEVVLEEADNFKKAQAIENRPVFLTKYVFSKTVDSLCDFLRNDDMLKILILEGLPLCNKYMVAFTKGLSQNSSIKSLSLSRSMIEDDGCEILCETVKCLPNIIHLDLSYCNIGTKGAEALANLIKFQHIQRFSEGWKKSLRYQLVNPESIPGLTKLNLNSNILIGDEGVKSLTEILKDDIWIKDIEMQNCGITDEGAESIIKCLDINKKILNFNIGSNPDISEHLYRHIVVQLGHSVQDNLDSKVSNEKVNCSRLREQLKCLQDQLETMHFQKKKAEDLNEQLHEQVLDMQKELIMQGAFQLPDGYTVILTETLEKLMKAQIKLQKIQSSRKMCKKHLRSLVKKAHSSTFPGTRTVFGDKGKVSKSECIVKRSERRQMNPSHFEKNMGDYVSNGPPKKGNQKPASECGSRISIHDLLRNPSFAQKVAQKIDQSKKLGFNEPEATRSLSGADVLHYFNALHRQENSSQKGLKGPWSQRDLFVGRPEYVPNNSDVESNQTC